MPYPDPFVLPDLVNGSATPDYRLSDAHVYFYLTSIDLDRSIPIKEPVGWDGATWNLSRDKDWHGVNFEYTGDEAKLTFDEPAAFAFLEEVYHGYGPSADVRLVWGLQYGADELPLQTLSLKLSTRFTARGVFTVSGEQLSLHPQIRTHWDTTLSMDAKQALVNDVNLKPVAVVPPAPTKLLLHAQRIKQTTIIPDIDKPLGEELEILNSGGATILSGANPFAGPGDVYRDFYYPLPLEETRATVNEVKVYSSSILGVSTFKPEDIQAPVFKTETPGSYHIELAVDLQADLQILRRDISISPPKITNFTFRCVIVAAGTTYDVFTPLTGSPNDRWLYPQRRAGSITLDLDLPANTPVYIYSTLHIDVNRDNWKGVNTRIDVFKCSLNISANTTAPSSSAPAYPVIDVLTHFVACLTGKANAVQSSYYSLASGSQPVDGGGAHRFNLNGYAIRGFLQKPMQSSLQKILFGYQAIDAIGISYKPTSTGEILVVEPIAFFYRDAEIMRLTSYTVIEESTSADYLHPSATFGYAKFPDEGPEVLDEFNTKQEYVLPGKAGSDYNQVSDLIASGYAIEQTRRVQFTDKPKDSTTYDDDTFVICASQTVLGSGNTTITLPGTFGTNAGKATLTVPKANFPAWITTGVTILLSGSVNNDGVYKVLALKQQLTPSIVGGSPVLTNSMVLTLDRAITPEIVAALTLSIGNDGIWQAERNTDFAKVTGVLDPATTYNLRLAPRFNYMRHGRYLAGGLVYTNGAEPIRCQFTKNNSQLRTQLKTNAAGDLNIDIRRLIDHSSTTYVADLTNPLDPIWLPETIQVKIKLTIDQMLYLRACYQGFHPDPELHYGFITLVNGDQEIPGFPLSISFTPASGEAVLTLLKKFVPLSQPTGQRGCSFYAGYTFADFESATSGSIDNWIERCLFDNFQ